MAKRIIWSENALVDRLQILNFWFERTGNKRYSKKLDAGFRMIIKKLAAFPKLGRQLTNREERFFVLESYQIF